MKFSMTNWVLVTIVLFKWIINLLCTNYQISCYALLISKSIKSDSGSDIPSECLHWFAHKPFDCNYYVLSKYLRFFGWLNTRSVNILKTNKHFDFEIPKYKTASLRVPSPDATKGRLSDWPTTHHKKHKV